MNIDSNPENAPDYLRNLVREPQKGSAADLLMDGNWTGHGEESAKIYDIVQHNSAGFQVFLPDQDSEESYPPAVKISAEDNSAELVIYDTKQHPASYYSFSDFKNVDTVFAGKHSCPECNHHLFSLAVGFEIPEDASGPNDTTWFILAGKCVNCGAKRIIFDDETG